MMSREELVTKLVLNQRLSAEERLTLGAFVSRDEVACAIERELRLHPRFPVAQGEGRMRVELTSEGPRVLLKSSSTSGLERFVNVRDAVERYIDVEIGPSCGGVCVRQRRPVDV